MAKAQVEISDKLLGDAAKKEISSLKRKCTSLEKKLTTRDTNIRKLKSEIKDLEAQLQSALSLVKAAESSDLVAPFLRALCAYIDAERTRIEAIRYY